MDKLIGRLLAVIAICVRIQTSRKNQEKWRNAKEWPTNRKLVRQINTFKKKNSAQPCKIHIISHSHPPRPSFRLSNILSFPILQAASFSLLVLTQSGELNCCKFTPPPPLLQRNFNRDVNVGERESSHGEVLLRGMAEFAHALQ